MSLLSSSIVRCCWTLHLCCYAPALILCGDILLHKLPHQHSLWRFGSIVSHIKLAIMFHSQNLLWRNKSGIQIENSETDKNTYRNKCEDNLLYWNDWAALWFSNHRTTLKGSTPTPAQQPDNLFHASRGINLMKFLWEKNNKDYDLILIFIMMTIAV